jgi:branched-chain amino acid transport system permease protein
MVYGILRLINFAHGDIFMLGAYFVFYGVTLTKLPWGVAVVVAVALAAVCGVFIDRIAYRPLRDAPRISALISAIGVSFFIENLGLVIFTGLPKPVYRPDWLVEIITFGNIRILPLAIIVPIIAFSLVMGLLWIVYKTKPGLAMRSISKDIETTRLMGVSVDKIIALTFGLGSALAAASGIMWALRYPQIHPFMGVFPGFKAFIAAVLGGIGSIQGAMIGGMLLGLIEIMAVAFFPTLSGYRDAFAFVLLIVILLMKPTGLMGEKLEEKV